MFVPCMIVIKISKSHVGDLVRIKNKFQHFITFSTFKLCINSNPQIIFFALKIVINPFLEAQDLLNKYHNAGTHCIYGEKSHRELHSYEKK